MEFSNYQKSSTIIDTDFQILNLFLNFQEQLIKNPLEQKITYLYSVLEKCFIEFYLD